LGRGAEMTQADYLVGDPRCGLAEYLEGLRLRDQTRVQQREECCAEYDVIVRLQLLDDPRQGSRPGNSGQAGFIPSAEFREEVPRLIHGRGARAGCGLVC
jgi:hypothetical protein